MPTLRHLQKILFIISLGVLFLLFATIITGIISTRYFPFMSTIDDIVKDARIELVKRRGEFCGLGEAQDYYLIKAKDDESFKIISDYVLERGASTEGYGGGLADTLEIGTHFYSFDEPIPFTKESIIRDVPFPDQTDRSPYRIVMLGNDKRHIFIEFIQL